jgi:hypothetical protein
MFSYTQETQKMSIHRRRTFLKSAGLGALALSLGQRTARAAQSNEKLILGVIGTGGMGSAHLKALAQRKDTKVAYVCDVDQNRLAEATTTVLSVAGTMPTPVDDLRRILDDREVDAVDKRRAIWRVLAAAELSKLLPRSAG